MRGEDDSDARSSEFLSQLDRVRPVTRRLIEAIMMDVWPNHTAIVDFGIDSQAHYEALYYPIREAEIMPQALDQALGHGEMLTTLTRNAPSNPHKDVGFSTSWDAVLGRDRPRAENADPPTPSDIARDAAAIGQGRDDSRRDRARTSPSPSEIACEPQPSQSPPERDRGDGREN